MDFGQLIYDKYKHHKFYHFFSLSFAMGCGLTLYRPYCSIVVPSFLGVFFFIIFEAVGIMSDLPPHTKRCKGPPYHRNDICNMFFLFIDAVWGFCVALTVASVHLRSYHVYTLSYGCGLMVFAVRGAKRKYSSLWEERLGARW